MFGQGRNFGACPRRCFVRYASAHSSRQEHDAAEVPRSTTRQLCASSDVGVDVHAKFVKRKRPTSRFCCRCVLASSLLSRIRRIDDQKSSAFEGFRCNHVCCIARDIGPEKGFQQLM